jgi:hypothetical protein
LNQVLRWVIYYSGPGNPPEDHRLRIREIPGLRVVDETSPRLLLVEAPESELRSTLGQLAGWIIEPEYPIRVPRNW